LKCFNLTNSYIAIEKKHQINIKNDNMSYNGNYGNLPEYDEEQEQEQHSCEILDTSRFVMGNGSASDDDSSDEYDYDFNIQDLQSPKAATETNTTTTTNTNTNTNTHTQSRFDLNDPLRYCLELNEITPNEYNKWKIVATKLFKRTTPPLDLGPGYNDTDDTDDTDDDETKPAGYGYEYGYGYVTRLQRPHHVEFYDPWFPNPDPTPNKQYTELATNTRHMMQQFVVFENNGEQSRLNYAFQLKLIWERFTASASASSSNPQSLQHFWQTNALVIYEALQECVEIQAKCFNILSSGAHKLIADTPAPEFHTTPVEMLENTFETIGRMSRCIAEDFNTQSIVNYVDEFIHALYTELYFMALM
jgi:hypothetical protein